jgi:hypothetical protein
MVWSEHDASDCDDDGENRSLHSCSLGCQVLPWLSDQSSEPANATSLQSPLSFQFFRDFHDFFTKLFKF